MTIFTIHNDFWLIKNILFTLLFTLSTFLNILFTLLFTLSTFLKIETGKTLQKAVNVGQ